MGVPPQAAGNVPEGIQRAMGLQILKSREGTSCESIDYQTSSRHTCRRE